MFKVLFAYLWSEERQTDRQREPLGAQRDRDIRTQVVYLLSRPPAHNTYYTIDDIGMPSNEIHRNNYILILIDHFSLLQVHGRLCKYDNKKYLHNLNIRAK